MSEITVIESAENQAHFGFDHSKIFIRDNQFYSGETLKNLSGGLKTFDPGTVLGMITANASGDKGKLIPVVAGATDGSNIPVGVLKTQVTDLADDAESSVTIAIAGHIADDKLIFDGAETVDTFTPNDLGKTFKFRLASDTMGIKVVEVTETTKFDNS